MIIKHCYARPQEKLGSAVYDTHRGYDIELNSLITSGRDWNERKHIVACKTANMLTACNVFFFIYLILKIVKCVRIMCCFQKLLNNE